MKNSHACKALAISCIDYRFVTKVRDFLTGQNLKDCYDLITTPGASLALDKIATDILTSMNLHNPREVYIFDHEDCGAYGVDNSEQRHKQNLEKAREIILKGHPNLDVHTYLAGFKQIKEVN